MTKRKSFKKMYVCIFHVLNLFYLHVEKSISPTLCHVDGSGLQLRFQIEVLIGFVDFFFGPIALFFPSTELVFNLIMMCFLRRWWVTSDMSVLTKCFGLFLVLIFLNLLLQALPNQQTVDYPSFKLVIVGDGGTGMFLCLTEIRF